MIRRDIPAGPGMVARIRFTERADGDFRTDGPAAPLAAIRRAVIDEPWTWMRQVHGADVVTVSRSGDHAGAEADAAVTTTLVAPLAVQTADCAPVVLIAEGCVAIAHAGWRGLVDGVLEAGVEAVRDRTPEPISALVGPCIRPGGYEFGPDDLERVERLVGPAARATTTSGRPALDLPGAVAAALHALDVHAVDDLGLDTVDDRWFSHRTRADEGRQASVVWLEAG